ncbi:MAG: type II toxin-antitoxin system RelE/ParE family toxin [bacterium]
MRAVRFTPEAVEDLERLFDHFAAIDPDLARKSNDAIKGAIRTLQEFPFSGRTVDRRLPFIREFIVSFGSSGYVVLFEIEGDEFVTVLAARHQREADYL